MDRWALRVLSGARRLGVIEEARAVEGVGVGSAELDKRREEYEREWKEKRAG